jgi:hypothetical protein
VERLVAEYEASGLTRDGFCQQRGLSVAALENLLFAQHVYRVLPRQSSGSPVERGPVEAREQGVRGRKETDCQ